MILYFVGILCKEALESSVVLEDNVKFDESDNWAYDKVDDAPIYSPEDFGVRGGRLAADG